MYCKIIAHKRRKHVASPFTPYKNMNEMSRLTIELIAARKKVFLVPLNPPNPNQNL